MEHTGKKRSASHLEDSDAQESQKNRPNTSSSSSAQLGVSTNATVEGSDTLDRRIFNRTMKFARSFGIQPGMPLPYKGLLSILLQNIAWESRIVFKQKVGYFVASRNWQSKLNDAWTSQSFQAIIKELKTHNDKSRVRYRSPSDDYYYSQADATVKSWMHPYKGRAPEALWAYIKYHFRPQTCPVNAYYLSVINSSGTGKSRMVDELSKSHFIIPINLRKSGTTGFPPADGVVRDFLTDSWETEDDAARCGVAFLAALFQRTAEHIDSQEWKGNIPAEFREQMSQGQIMEKVGPFREAFYESVVDRACELLNKTVVSRVRMNKGPTSIQSGKVSSQDTAMQSEAVRDDQDHGMHISPSTSSNHPRDNTQRSPPQLDMLIDLSISSFEQLQESLEARGFRKSVEQPLVTLAFDEAHTLMETQDDEIKWSRYDEIFCALPRLKRCSLYSLFLSTAGRIVRPVRSLRAPSSSRVVGLAPVVTPPFTDLGMDQLADIIAIDDKGTALRQNTGQPITLEEVVHPRFMARLGRPLFGSRYGNGDNDVKETIIIFAAYKLIRINSQLPRELDAAQALACLSQRLCLQLEPSSYNDLLLERDQVQGHLRVCLKMDSESILSTSASEPLLAEAARYVMNFTDFFRAPEGLWSILRQFSIQQGYQGGLLVSLLLTVARDNAVGTETINSGVIKINDFMESLVRTPGDKLGRNHKDILHMIPPSGSLSQNSDTTISQDEMQKTFHDTFANAQFHFNHFIRVHEEESIAMERLLAYLIRGAGVLCTNCQLGIDGVIAFLMHNSELNLGQLGVMLWQVKNGQTYTHVPKWYMFDSMDPFALGIYPKKAKNTQPGQEAGSESQTPWNPPPVIRIFFALAAKTPSLRMQKSEFKSKVAGATFTAFDIWCAGISPDILAPIHASGANVWISLLQASYGWKQTYKGDVREQEDLRRTMNPGAGTSDDHFKHWIQFAKASSSKDDNSEDDSE